MCSRAPCHFDHMPLSDSSLFGSPREMNGQSGGVGILLEKDKRIGREGKER